MKYLAITGYRSEHELLAYLYAYARVQDSGTTRQGLNWAVVECPSDHAEHQQGRLHSGFIGCRVNDTEYFAALACLERA